MDDSLTRPPQGVSLNDLSASVFALLARHTAFPWPVLKTQAERMGYDGSNLGPRELEAITELIARGVARFNSPEAGRAVQLELKDLVAEQLE